jgi:hypothetical protein
MRRRTAKDPVLALPLRARREWLRRERRIVAEHHDALLERVEHLAAERPPVTTMAITRCPPGTVLRIGLPGWRLTLAASAVTAEAALAIAPPEQLRLVGAGRYGRFWWLHLRDESDRLAVLLGSHLSLQALGWDPAPGRSSTGVNYGG